MPPELLSASSSDESARATSRFGRWVEFLFRPKIAIPLIVIVFPVIGMLAYRTITISRVPPAVEPFDIKAVLEFAVPDKDNAFHEYRAASTIYVPYIGSPDELELAQNDGWEHATDAIRKWLDANRPFMELWKKGTAKPDAQYFRASELSVDTLLPAVQDAREFTRLVRLESARLVAEEKPEQAWDWLRINFRMSRHLGRHGTMIERLVGIATHGTTAEGMVKWANESHITSEMLRRAMRELRDEQQRVTPPSNSMKLDYIWLSSLMRSFSLKSVQDKEVSPESSLLNRVFFFVRGEPEISERVIRHVFANWLSQADKLRRERTKMDASLGLLFEPDPMILKPQSSTWDVIGYFQGSILARKLIPAGPQMLIATDREAARDVVLLTVLALELFAREHGHYPEKLEELVPDFLPEVPEDTHTPPKTPLRYRRDGDEALIYGVGDNGVDDGGLFEKVEDIGYRIGKPREKMSE